MYGLQARYKPWDKYPRVVVVIIGDYLRVFAPGDSFISLFPPRQQANSRNLANLPMLSTGRKVFESEGSTPTCDFSSMFSAKERQGDEKKRKKSVGVRLAIPQIANGTKR